MSAIAEQIDISPSTVARELRKVMRGEVRDDPYARTLYATDASIYEIEPLCAAFPLDEDDVRAAVWFARKYGVPIIGRGAGSGLTGESLGRGIILDFNVHMARIIELDKHRTTVCVEPGVVLDSLNRALKPHGYRIGPDPSSSNRATVGGAIANNACGARSIKYGAMRKHIASVRVVLSDGTVTNLRAVPLNGPDHERKKGEQGLAGKIWRELPLLIEKHAAAIEAASKKVRSERNRCGYLLDGVIKDGIFDPVRLIAASEGTLGVLSEAVLRVVPLQAAVGVACVTFNTIVEAARAIPAIRECNVVACELFDREILRLGREAKPENAGLLPDAGAMLVIEVEGEDRGDVENKLMGLHERLQKGVVHQSFRRLPEPGEQQKLWETRKAATPLLFRRHDSLQPLSIVEDAALPVDRLAEYFEKMIKIFEKHKLEFTCYGHAGHGEVHFKPLMNLKTKEHVDLMEKVAADCHALVWSCEGTISGEHGEGLARAQWIEKQAGPELYAAFKEVKELFDPVGVLNPNKKITADKNLMSKNLRFGMQYRFSEGARPRPNPINPTQAANYRMFKAQTNTYKGATVEAIADNPADVHRHGLAMLNWTEGEMAHEAEKCNGNGHCRSTGNEVDMCPRFKYNRVEDASPRAKANILRRMMSGRQRDGSFWNPQIIETMDYCFNCKLCVDDCPSAVNIPKLSTEAKARYHQGRTLPLSKWVFTKSEFFSKLGRAFAPVANAVNELGVTRWLAEKVFSIDRRRPLPRFKSLNFKLRAPGSVDGSRPKVVLYLDLYAKYNAPEIGQAAIDVLEHQGFEVIIPEAPWTNMPALMHGEVVEARETIRKVSAALAPYAFQGIPILVTEPTATLCLTKEFLDYLDTPEVRAVARHARDIFDFLGEIDKDGKLRADFHSMDLSVGYHQPCHHKALKIGQPGMEFLKKIPGVKVEFIDQGCCGIAGTFGMTKKNYDESMWIGKGLFKELSKTTLQFGASECSTCQMQMEHGTGKTTVHPIQIVAAAYGFAIAQPKEFGSAMRLDSPVEPAHAHADDHAHAGAH